MLKRLKQVAVAVLGLVLVFGLYNVHAAWNLQQISNGKSAGGAQFTPTDPSFGPARVGRTIITHTIADVNTAATHYITSPITGRLREVLLVPDNTLASALTLAVFLDASTASTVFTALAPTGRLAASSATGVPLRLFNFFMRSSNVAASAYSDAEWLANGISGYTGKASVKQYRPIVLRIDNGSGSTKTGNLVITIDPE